MINNKYACARAANILAQFFGYWKTQMSEDGEDEGPLADTAPASQSDAGTAPTPSLDAAAAPISQSVTVAVSTCFFCGRKETPPYCVHCKCTGCNRKREYEYGCTWANCCKRCFCTNGRDHDSECDSRQVLPS